MPRLIYLLSRSYRLRPALSCFEEHATEDIFNNLYRSQINNLIPSAAVVGLPEMTLRELIDYLDTSCVNTGKLYFNLLHDMRESCLLIGPICLHNLYTYLKTGLNWPRR